jgi:hypothetical protein
MNGAIPFVFPYTPHFLFVVSFDRQIPSVAEP